MSIPAMNAVFALGTKNGLTAVQQLVLLTLADNADDNGLCWPGQRLVAEKCGRERRTVRRTLEELSADGWISLVSIPGRSHPGYQLHLPSLTNSGRDARPRGRDARPPSEQDATGRDTRPPVQAPGSPETGRASSPSGRASSADGREARPEPSLTQELLLLPASPEDTSEDISDGSSSSGDESGNDEKKRGLVAALEARGVWPKAVRRCLISPFVDTAWTRIKEWDAARAAGDAEGPTVDAGLLVDNITLGHPITTPERKGSRARAKGQVRPPTRYWWIECPKCKTGRVTTSTGDEDPMGVFPICRNSACPSPVAVAMILMRELKREDIMVETT